jgi:hypothetical protein
MPAPVMPVPAGDFLTGKDAKVIFTMYNRGDGTAVTTPTAVTLANSEWSRKGTTKLAEFPNVRDGGIYRKPTVFDYSGDVNGFLAPTTPPEAEMGEGSIGMLQLFTDDTHYYPIPAIINDVDINTSGVTEPIKVKFSYQRQLGGDPIALATVAP